MAKESASSGHRAGSFGPALRKAREDRGIDLGAIADSTKIGKDKLRALESNRFEELPGGVFNRGFVRAVAECIGVDAEEMVAAYEEEERAQSDRRRAESDPELEAYLTATPPPASSPAEKRSGRPWTLVILAALGLATVSMAALVLRKESSSKAAPAPATNPPAARSAASPAPRSVPVEEKEIAPAIHDTRNASEPEEAASPPAEDSDQPAEEAAPAIEPSAPAAPEPAGSSPAPPVDRAGVEEEPPPAAAPATGLRVVSAALGAGVVDHALREERSIFTEGERAYFWTRVEGGGPGEIVEHVWMREGLLVSVVEIELGGGNFRAHSYQTMHRGSAGRWSVEARDGDDRVLARREFDCVKSPENPG